MKRAVPVILGCMILLPLAAIFKFGDGPDRLTEMHHRKAVEFKSAMTEALRVDESQEEEFNNLLTTLPELNFNALMDTVKTGVTTGETCHVCYELFHAAKIAFRQLRQREMMKMATLACATFVTDMINSDVCLGLLKQYFDSIYHIANAVFAAGIDRNDVCSVFFGPTCGPMTSDAHIWKVDLPRRIQSVERPRQDPPTSLNVLHLSDFHYDPMYREGAEAECSLPLCCREMPRTLGGRALMRKDTLSKLAGRFGDFRRCDMPLETLDSLVIDAARAADKISHVYLTGDIPPHDVWTSNSSEYFSITQSIYNLLAHRMGRNVPVYASIGNHEAVPTNLFAANGNELNSETVQKTAQLYENMARFWSPWLDEEQLATVRIGGFYAKSISPSLKVISLNTNMCYYLNFYLLIDSRDPGGQLKWLVRELAQSEARGQKVHILGHIPPSSFDCVHTWSQQYLRIVQRFNSTITGQFFGHTHVDEFNVFYAEDRTTPVGVAFMAPSATSYSQVNPAYKMFTCNEDGVLRNAITRSVDLATANARGRIHWQVEYDAAATFNLADLTPASMDVLAQRVNTEPGVFDTYYRFYHRNSPSSSWSNCTDARKSSIAAATLTDVHHNGPKRLGPRRRFDPNVRPAMLDANRGQTRF